MALDPTARFILTALVKQGVKSFEQMSIAEARQLIDIFPQLQNAPEPVERLEALSLDGVPLRVYTPAHADGSAIPYTHGGGWIGGHRNVCDEPVRALANDIWARSLGTAPCVPHRRATRSHVIIADIIRGAHT